MKCALCGKEFNNAEEMKEHNEQMHPMDELEAPDMIENPEVKREMRESEPAEMPVPVERTP